MKTLQMKKMALLFCMCLVVSLCTGCGAAKDQVFTETGFSVTLTEDFQKSTAAGYSYYYESNDAIVMVAEETKELIESAGLTIASPEEYAEICIAAQPSASEAVVASAGQYACCEYTETIDGQDYAYYAAFYESDSAFYAVTFACMEADYESMKPTLEKWAASFTVK